MLRWADKEYNDPEIIITENGFSDRGTLEDNDRISYFNVFFIQSYKPTSLLFESHNQF